MALIEYRKKKGDQIWHFCQNCPDYPKEDYDSWCGGTRPPGGKICEECILLEEEHEKDCNPNYCY